MELTKKIEEQVTIKNIKTDIGHDLAGYYCDLYFNGKKIGYVNDDGWGGEIEVWYNDEAIGKEFMSFLTAENIQQLCADSMIGENEKYGITTGYVYTAADFRNENEVISFLVSELLNRKEDEKEQKRIEKAFLTSIVTEKPDGVAEIFWVSNKRRIPLQAMCLSEKGKAMIITKLSELKNEGAKVLNTNLEALGLV